MRENLTIEHLRCGANYGLHTYAAGTAFTSIYKDFAFLWCRHGAATCHIGPASCDVGEGDVMLIGPLQAVRWQVEPASPCVMHSFAFNVKSLPAQWPPRRDWPIKRHMSGDDVLRPLFEYVVRHVTRDEKDIEPCLTAAAATMLSTFVQGSVDRTPSFVRSYPMAVQRALQWIGRAIADPSKVISLEDLAASAGVRPTHFCGMFRRHVGVPPLKYIYMLRLTRSLISLASGEKVNVIARMYGFADTAHYNRRFRAFFGMTPAQMRQAMAKGYEYSTPNLPLMGHD